MTIVAPLIPLCVVESRCHWPQPRSGVPIPKPLLPIEMDVPASLLAPPANRQDVARDEVRVGPTFILAVGVASAHGSTQFKRPPVLLAA